MRILGKSRVSYQEQQEKFLIKDPVTFVAVLKNGVWTILFMLVLPVTVL